MKLSDQEKKLKELLKETLTLLCKSGLSYESNFCIEALIGITLDGNNGFFMTINESIHNETGSKKQENKSKPREELPYSDRSDDELPFSEGEEKTCINLSKIDKIPSPSKFLKRKIKSSCDNHSSPVQKSPKLEGTSDAVFVEYTNNTSSSASSYQRRSPQDLNSIPNDPDDDDDDDDDGDLVFIKTEPMNYEEERYSTPQMNAITNFPESSSKLSGFTTWHSVQPSGPTFQDETSQILNTSSNSQVSSYTNVGTTNTGCICPLCAKPYRYRQGLKDHMRAVHGMGEPLKCECGESFLWRMTRDNHKKTCAVVLQQKERKIQDLNSNSDSAVS